MCEGGKEGENWGPGGESDSVSESDGGCQSEGASEGIPWLADAAAGVSHEPCNSLAATWLATASDTPAKEPQPREMIPLPSETATASSAMASGIS